MSQNRIDYGIANRRNQVDFAKSTFYYENQPIKPIFGAKCIISFYHMISSTILQNKPPNLIFHHHDHHDHHHCCENRPGLGRNATITRLLTGSVYLLG